MLDLLDLSWDPTAHTTPVDFYNIYRSTIQGNLGRRGDVVKWKNITLMEDEQLSPSHEDLILVNVLTLIHPLLPRYVKDKYGHKIGQTQRLMDFKTEILALAAQYISDIEPPQPVQVEFYTEVGTKEELNVMEETDADGGVHRAVEGMVQSSLQLPGGGIEVYISIH